MRALPLACNVSDWDACDELVERVTDAWGGIDVLVNNAGMSPVYDTVDQVTEALFDKVIAVNLKGPFRLSAAFGAQMVAQGSGSIIRVSSMGAVRPTADVVPYAAAKAGLNNLTEGLAAAPRADRAGERDHAWPIRHRHRRALGPEQTARATAHTALGRVGRTRRDRRRRAVPGLRCIELLDRAVLHVDGGMP